MTDTGIRYTHCRGPHRDRREVGGDDARDGLCSVVGGGCTHRYFMWCHANGKSTHPLDSIERSVAIDQWLEAGAP